MMKEPSETLGTSTEVEAKPRMSAPKVSYGPWIAGLLFAVSTYFFWIRPFLVGKQPVKVEFENSIPIAVPGSAAVK